MHNRIHSKHSLLRTHTYQAPFQQNSAELSKYGEIMVVGSRLLTLIITKSIVNVQNIMIWENDFENYLLTPHRAAFWIIIKNVTSSRPISIGDRIHVFVRWFCNIFINPLQSSSSVYGLPFYSTLYWNKYKIHSGLRPKL